MRSTLIRSDRLLDHRTQMMQVDDDVLEPMAFQEQEVQTMRGVPAMGSGLGIVFVSGLNRVQGRPRGSLPS